MGLIGTVIVHAMWPALEFAMHGWTPLATINALTFGNLLLLWAQGERIVSAPSCTSDGAVRHVIALWGMASLSMLIWAGCVVLLHGAGVL